MEFYSVVRKCKVNIPASKIRKEIRKGREFAVGKYTWKGKEYEAWRVLGKAPTKRKR